MGLIDRVQAKIEYVRSQPEDVRMRYTLMCVGVSMTFIGILWLFSITTSFQKPKEPLIPEGLPNMKQSVSGALNQSGAQQETGNEKITPKEANAESRIEKDDDKANAPSLRDAIRPLP